MIMAVNDAITNVIAFMDLRTMALALIASADFHLL